MKTIGLLGVAALGLGLLVTPAKAAFLGINDTTEHVTVSLNDFEFGFHINGNLAQVGTNSPRVVPVPEAFSFDGSWILGGPLQDSGIPHNVFFVEAGTPGLISDILTYTYFEQNGLGHIEGRFTSDTEGTTLGTLPAVLGAFDRVVLEDGSAFDFSNTNITAQATSDAETVPLPSSAWGGIALLGLAGGYRLVRGRARLA